jgi:hypothetical protein
VQRFGKQYFDLLAKYGKDLGRYLASDDEVVVVLDGQAYSF